MRKILIYTVLLVCLAGVSAFAGTINLTSKPEEVSQYQPFILRFDLPYFSGNPNDPARIKAEALITTPSGKKAVVPAFCSWNKDSNKKSSWEVRFTPVEKGNYNYFIKMESGLKREKRIRSVLT